MFEDAKYVFFFLASPDANVLSIEAGIGTFENWKVEILQYGCMTFSVWERVTEGCRLFELNQSINKIRRGIICCR